MIKRRAHWREKHFSADLPFTSPCEVSDTQHCQKHNPERGDLIEADSFYVPLKSGQKTSVWGKQRQMEKQKG